MAVDFSPSDNKPQSMVPTQQRAYTRFSRSTDYFVRSASALEMVALLPELVELFTETVNGGSPLGFLPPINHALAREYWISLIRDLEERSRILLIAYSDNLVVGSGQLAFSKRANSPHRAEMQKVFVERASRGHGVGRSLVRAMHDAALKNGRTLIHLSTRRGEPAERFYKSLGYKEAGVIPGWTIDRTGERYDHVTLYQDITRESGYQE
jgi:GNAT superfamily N-acetyltransferase